MIRSMTGFGEAEREIPEGLLRLEVKTVNHRFFNAGIKTPSGFDRYEKDISDTLRRFVARGHVSAFLSLDRSGSTVPAPPRVDVGRARQYQEALEALRFELEIPGEVDLSLLARFSDVFRAPEGPSRTDVDPEVIRDLAAEAARAVVSMREAEGRNLAEDLSGRLAAMDGLLDQVEARAPERLVAERDRLREAVRELSGQVEVDEDRLAREVAYLAERWDINEELVRYRSHIALFREALASDGAEPVGKRLSFLVQEMHREANTIGSKANDAAIAHASVGLKDEIERVREQVENVE
ncbi:MAG: YicC family protein [Gemmatimonadota bacterium]|nr:YicC family protein [Gemmatimonadota bacterium]MDH5759282.1 YicC family protein [Gemmatimonadota bacterium]